MDEQEPRNRPRITWYERYVQHALSTYQPCADCPPEAFAVYREMQGAAEAADAWYRRAYGAAARLSHLTTVPGA